MASNGGGNNKEDRFAYKTMASIVHKQDRKEVVRDEPTGESEKITSQELKHEMGSAVTREAAVAATNKKRKKDMDVIKSQSSNYEDLLRVGGSYEPTTKLTEKVWEQYLALISQLMPSAERDVLRSAAEESLNVLKSNDQYNAQQRRVQMEKLLDCRIPSDEDFRAFMACADQLTDFIVQTDATPQQQQQQRKKDTEIAIVFEDDEDGGAAAAAAAGDGEELEYEVVSSESEGDDDDKAAGIHGSRVDVTSTGGNVPLEEDIDPITIDGFWLQRELAQHLQDEHDAKEIQTMSEDILTVFSMQDIGQVENHLVSLLGFDRFDLVKRLLKNRIAVYFCTKLHRAKTEQERNMIREEMLMSVEGKRILDQLSGDAAAAAPTAVAQQQDKLTTAPAKQSRMVPSGRFIDLAALSRLSPAAASHRGGEVLLPKGSWRRPMKTFEEVHVQPPKSREQRADDPPLVKISDLPAWMHMAFKGMTELNRVQSKVFPAVLSMERYNMLVSAPTSAGKTNIAMLAVMREMSEFVDPTTGKLDVVKMKQGMKIVYVAPMKALVQEVVQNFSSRLTNEELGVEVRELSGDSQLTRQQIKDTQILVTTPEKWDVVSRKAGERSFVSLVKLVIVDEIHLLNDTRGAVLEALIARILYTNHNTSTDAAGCRVLGISATLPNYMDVAQFLRVPVDRGLFYFDASYRPVPLHQVFVGVKDQKAINRAKQMDQICFDKALDSAKRDHQVLIFVHSRKATARLAKLIQQRAEETDQVDAFLPASMASREILLREVVNSADLKSLLAYGLAIHHAGMTKKDRTLVEDLFAAGHIRVLVSTATLAWGVNLPAHTVIIAGTQVYNPERACWAELPQLDLLQMLGRAGRPQFDTEGEGLVVTTFTEMQYYLSLCNSQLQVESSLLQRLPEHINAEVVIGNISSLAEAVEWLRFTYLYHRAKQVPARYGVMEEDFDQWQVDICHAALLVLESMHLVHYDSKSTFQVQGTALGRITSHYYLSPETMNNFVKVLDGNASSSLMDLIRIITVADEFKQITVRHEEKLELAKLAERVPVPIKESLEEPSAKVNILLQAYISNWTLDGYCLRCDLIYIHQSASRLCRALFEICLHKKFARAALTCLNLCLSLDRKLWKSQFPLRQLTADVDEDVMRQLERKALTFSRYQALAPSELAALVKNGSRQIGQQLHQLIHRFPKLDLQARVQTLSRSSIKMQVAVNCDFEFDEDVLGQQSLLFWLLVLDNDGNELFHCEPFALKSRFALEEHVITLLLTDLPDPLPMFLLVKLESDRFLHSTSSLAVPLHSLVLPKKSLPFTELLDLSPLQVASLPDDRTREFFLQQNIHQFWPMQTQSYSLMMQQQDNVLLAMPVGKTILFELAMLRALENDEHGARILYLAPNADAVQVKLSKWTALFKNKQVGMLRGFDAAEDLKILQESQIVLSTAKVFEVLSRRWRQKSRRVVYELSLCVCDDLQVADVDMEICMSRLRYISVNLDRAIRMVGVCCSNLNAEDFASWLGNAKLISLAPSARPAPTEVTITGFSENHFETRQGLMIRPAFRAMQDTAMQGHRAMAFFPSKRHVRLALIDFIQFSQHTAQDLVPAGVTDGLLKTALQYGISVIHEGLNDADLHTAQQGNLILVSVQSVWKLRDDFLCTHSVVVGTSWFQNKRYEEYPLHLVQKLVNKAVLGSTTKQTIYCFEPHKPVLKKSLTSGVFLESNLESVFGDVLLGEICTTKTVTTKQEAVDFFTWTLFYRRLVKNPSYYFHASQGSSNASMYLSEIVDNAVQEIRDSLCLEEDDDDRLTPTSLGMIAAFHDVKASTMELFSTSLDTPQQFKLARIFDLVSSASEFLHDVDLRPREEFALQALGRNSLCVSLVIPNAEEYTDTHVKVNVLLQTWCNNKLKMLSAEQRQDLLSTVLLHVPKLLHALVDLASSQAWLRASMACLEVCQTVVQQVWQTDSVLKQIPHVEELDCSKLRTVYDLIEMEDDERNVLFSGMEEDKIQDIAAFCNAYPSVTVEFHVMVNGEETSRIEVNQPVTIQVLFTQDEEEEEGDGKVVSRRFPHPKTNLWWAILGEESAEEDGGVLVAIKRVNNRQATLSCEFASAGKKKLKLFVMCDSYLGCDQQFNLELEVV